MDAHTINIPDHAWPQALRDLTDRYAGYGIRISIMRRDLGDQPVIDGPSLALEEITLEDRGSEAGNILVDIGDFDRALTIHRVARPRRLSVAETRPGDGADVCIESEDGTVTLITLTRRRQLPDNEAPGRTAGREPRHQRAPVRIGRQQRESPPSQRGF